MNRPQNNEYNPYFQRYIDLIPTEDYFELFDKNTASLIDYFTAVPLEKHNYQYEAGKWSTKQVLMHIIDTERIFAYRLLVILRGDQTTKLQTYDDDLYASNVNVVNRTMDSLLEEFKVVRKNFEFILRNMTEEQSQLTGNIDIYPTTPRALAYIILGHVAHHLRILNERYYVVLQEQG